jgi:hypothetical protein
MGAVGPALGSSYRQSEVGVLGMMLLAVREEFERAAARRAEENDELRRLFREAAPAVRDAGLRARLEAAAEGRDESLLVADLERGNAELRALLVELHAHAEELESPEARRIEAAVWRELAASTERRKLMMGPF